MPSWWRQVKDEASRTGWGYVIGWWFLLFCIALGALVVLRVVVWLIWQLSGQTPPDQLLDL